MKIKQSVFTCAILFTLFINTTTISAYTPISNIDDINNQNGTTVQIEGNLKHPNSYQNQVSRLLSNPNIEEVVVIDPDYAKTNSINAIEFSDFNLERSVTTHYYRISNVRNASDWTGSIIATAKGTPGTNLGISKTVTISSTYSTSASINVKKAISASVGFDVTSSNAISVSGNATVPYKYNGRNVRTMSLNARTIYKKKIFNIDRHTSVGGINHGWSNGWGSGSASKPYGVSFSKSYEYK